MALITIKTRSKELGKEISFQVFLNENAKPPYPTYYLLHGYSDNETNWTRNTRLEHYAANYPFLIVMPNGELSYYCDSALGHFESLVAKELVSFIDRTFPTRQQKRYRAIGGLSMGGYGALKIGLKHHDTFGVIAAHSSAVDFAHVSYHPRKDRPGMQAIIDDISNESNDLYALSTACPKAKRPKIYFDCGRDDFLFKNNEAFRRHLLKNKIPHTYKRYAGAHSWDYWDTHIQDALAFAAKSMKIKKV